MGIRVDPSLLPKTHQIRVVVHHRGYLEVITQMILNGIVVPARHADRASNPAGVPVDRTRNADCGTAQARAGTPGPFQQLIKLARHHRQCRLWPPVDVALDHGLDQHVPRRRANCQTAVGRAEVGHQDGRQMIIDAQPGGGSAAAVDDAAVLDQVAGLKQCVDPEGHC